MPNMGGLGFSQVAVLAAGFGGNDWLTQFGAIPARKSFEECGKKKGVLVASWYRFYGLEVDDIVTIKTPVRDDARERVNRYESRSRAKRLLMVIEVEES